MSGIGVNLRVTGHCSQGGRKYMEDTFSVAYQQTEDLKDLEYAYFGIFDGHGGPEAALYAKDHLIDAIVSQTVFWSENDEDVLRAIHDGYIQTHYAMWKHHETWPRTATGLPSTSGTTATVAFIRRGKIYIGHVGDSCIVLGYQEKGEKSWKARALTVDHKPETRVEIDRIIECGGKVVSKSGVPRVVWNRPRLGHKGPVRRSTPIDEIPFLAVARALGDFWSYNSASNKFVVSPEPDVSVHPVDVETFRCLILGTDGLWNMLSPAVAVTIVQATENHNEKQVVYPPDQFVMQYNKDWINPSKMLVDNAVKRWANARQRADNTSVVTLMLDPPGPPKAQILLHSKQFVLAENIDDQPEVSMSERETVCDSHSFSTKHHPSSISNPSSSGVAIFTRYPAVSSNQTSAMTPLTKYLNSVSLSNSAGGLNSNPKVLIRKSDKIRSETLLNQSRFSDSRNDIDDSIHMNQISNAEPEISITNTESTPAAPCDKRKHVASTINPNSYNFRLKQKLRLPEKEDERNSDVENMEQWSQRWSEVPSSSSQSSVKKSKSKRRRCSFEQNSNKPLNWSCPSLLSISSLDKSHLHQKHKSFQETTTRILRSDTIANTPVKTLRSRNIDLSSTVITPPAMKPKSEDLRIRSVHSKSCLHRCSSPKRCVRAASFPSSTCPQNKKLSKIPSFSSSSVTTRRSASRRIMK